jgi:hypothetical protein
VPDDVVGETDDLVAGSFGHLGETFCLGLIFERVAGEIDAWREGNVRINEEVMAGGWRRTGSVDVGLDEDVDPSHAVESDFFIFVEAPVAHLGKIRTARVVLSVACIEDQRVLTG